MSNLKLKSSRKKRGSGKVKVILMHSLAKKGKFGDCIEVKRGFAKNFLVPNGIALFANKANLLKFEDIKRHAQEKSDALKKDAMILFEKINTLTIIIKAQAAQDGRIFGSVSSKNIIDVIQELDSSISLEKNHIFINIPIKNLGSHSVQFNLNPDVIFSKSILVINANEDKKNTKIKDDEEFTLGYDYNAQVRSGDKRFDYLDKEER